MSGFHCGSHTKSTSTERASGSSRKIAECTISISSSSIGQAGVVIVIVTVAVCVHALVVVIGLFGRSVGSAAQGGSEINAAVQRMADTVGSLHAGAASTAQAATELSRLAQDQTTLLGRFRC